MAPPRLLARDSPMLVDTNASGESAGKSILTELAGSSGVSWARTDTTAQSSHRDVAASRMFPDGDRLLQDDIVDDHLTGLAIDIAGTDFALCVDRLIRNRAVMIQKRQAAC